MSLLKIARMGHPVLWQGSEPVTDPTVPGVHRLAQDMIETMIDAPGVGLAAPQVYAPLRLVVVRAPAERNDGREEPISVLINPQIESLSDHAVDGWEGCLSVPGWRGVVSRTDRIGVRYLDLNGRVIEREFSGFAARVVQHEVDHLDGMLYVQRIPDLRRLAFNDEAHHIAQRMAGTD